MTEDRRLRLTVSGPTTLITELAAPRDGVERLKSGEHVAGLPVTARERAQGVRRFEVVVGGWRFEVAAEPADRAALREQATRAAREHHAAVEISLRAQIPGRVVRLWVTDGQQVEQGERLLAVEAMKMENEVRAPHAGRVHDLRVAIGTLVEGGDELLSIS